MARKLQISIALDTELRELLEELANEAGRSIADEIRERIERTLDQDKLMFIPAKGRRRIAVEIKDRLLQSLDEDQFDWPTRGLARDIMTLAEDIKASGVGAYAWHQHVKAHEALAAAVMVWLESIKPPHQRSAAPEALFGPDDPQTLGRTIARVRLRLKAQHEKEMRALQERGRALERECVSAQVNLVKELTARIRKGREGEKS
jgi:predicted DNA-binding protein